MTGLSQGVAKPISIANPQIQTPQTQSGVKQPAPDLSNSTNDLISNKISKDANFSKMDVFEKKLSKKVGKKDKTPKIGIIETPPYNKTPIENELNKLKSENPNTKNKKHKAGFDASGVLILGVILMGAVLLISQIQKPVISLLKKIFHK